MKKLLFARKNDKLHWVGDGFPVRTIFSYSDIAKEISPFLLLDYAGPAEFPPSDHIRGVGEHPHRGFETVTIIYSGEVEHRDSGGGGGLIRAGDVQWMTAASGVVHEEKHSREYAKKGGPFEMIQLWINLPKKDKMSKPRYQAITDEQIPQVKLSKGSVRVIAGTYGEQKGPASTFTPMNVWDIRLKRGAHEEFRIPSGHTTALFLLTGGVQLGSGETVSDAELAVLDNSDEKFSIAATNDSKILLLSGEPIREPIVGYGPFVMNTGSEIEQAIADYQSGRMGHLPQKST